MNYTKKYGKGWFKESYRHSLAAKGIKTKNRGLGFIFEKGHKYNTGLVTHNPNYSKAVFKDPKAKDTISYLGKELEYRHTYNEDEFPDWSSDAQTIINAQKRRGISVAVIHRGKYHDLYSEPINYSKSSTQQQINTILYNPKKQQTDKEVLTIEVPRDKSQHLKFLKTYTKFKTKGLWKGIEDNNVQIEVEFKDSKDEKYGKRLINLFNTLNKDKIKEDVLYVRTEPVEESSLR